MNKAEKQDTNLLMINSLLTAVNKAIQEQGTIQPISDTVITAIEVLDVQSVDIEFGFISHGLPVTTHHTLEFADPHDLIADAANLQAQLSASAYEEEREIAGVIGSIIVQLQQEQDLN